MPDGWTPVAEPDGWTKVQETSNAPQPEAMRRSRTGALYTTKSDFTGADAKEFAQPFIDAVNPMSYVRTAQALYNDPKGTLLDAAKTPVRVAGDLIGGNAPRALGTLTMGLLAARLPRLVSGEAKAAPAVEVERYRPNVSGYEPPQTAGSGAAVPTAAPEAAATPAPAPPAQPPTASLPEAWQRFATPPTAPRPMPSHAPAVSPEMVPVGGESAYNTVRAQPAKVTRLDEPKLSPREQVRSDLLNRPDIVANARAMQERAATAGRPAPTDAPMWQVGKQPMKFRSDLGEQAAPFGRMDTPNTGLEPGSPEARSMSGMHKYDAETVSRYQHMLGNQNGNISPQALKALGVLGAPGRAVAYPMAYHYGGPWAAGSLAAVDAARLVASHPQASAQGLRAAILAQMVGHGSQP